MASLLLRPVLLPLARPLPPRLSALSAPSAPIHSSASLNTQDNELDPMLRLSNALSDAAADVENMNSEDREESEPTSHDLIREELARLDSIEDKVKPFRPNVPLRPRDFTQKYRSQKIRTTKERLVAPTAAKAKREDIFHLLNLNPLSFTNHPSVLGYFVSEMGMIYPRTSTGLTPKSQRAVSRAIRRAKMMGIMPTHSAPDTR